MAYDNSTTEEPSCETAFSQYPPVQNSVQSQMVLGQPHMHAVQSQYPMQIAFGKYASGYSRITSVCLGVLQILLGLMSIAAATIAILWEASVWELGTGFWCGAIYLTAGSVQIAAGANPTNELITAATVLATLVFPVAIAQLSLAICGLVDSIVCEEGACITTSALTIVANAAMGNIGAFEMVFGLCLFIVGIRAMCCSPQNQQMILMTNDAPAAPGVGQTALSTVIPTSQNNMYTVEGNMYDEMQNHHHHHPLEATAPDYSLSNGGHKDSKGFEEYL